MKIWCDQLVSISGEASTFLLVRERTFWKRIVHMHLPGRRYPTVLHFWRTQHSPQVRRSELETHPCLIALTSPWPHSKYLPLLSGQDMSRLAIIQHPHEVLRP